MAQPETVMKAIREAVAKKTSETGGRNAVAAVLSRYGHHKLPRVHSARAPAGFTVRVYVWQGTPAGDIALITGPSVTNEVKYLDDLQAAKAAPGAYVQAVEGGRAEDQARGGMERVVDRERARQERAAAPKAPRAPRARPAAAPAKPWVRMPGREFPGERAPEEPRVVVGTRGRGGAARGNPADAWKRRYPKPAPEFEELPAGVELLSDEEARQRNFATAAGRRYAQAAADAREDIARERFGDAAVVLTKAMSDVREMATDSEQRMEGERLANVVLGPVRAELDAALAQAEDAEAEVPTAEVREAVEHAEEAADTAYARIMAWEWAEAVGPALDAQATADYALEDEFGGDDAVGSWYERSWDVARFGEALGKLVDAAQAAVGEGETEEVRDHMGAARDVLSEFKGVYLEQRLREADKAVAKFIAAEEEQQDATRMEEAVASALQNIDKDILKPDRLALELGQDWRYGEIADSLADLHDPESEQYQTYDVGDVADSAERQRNLAPDVHEAVWPQIRDEVAYLEELLAERTGKAPAVFTRGLRGAGVRGPAALVAPVAPVAPAEPTEADHMAAFRVTLVQAIAEAKAQGLL